MVTLTDPVFSCSTVSIVLQHSYRRTLGIHVHARRLVTSRATVKSSPWSKSPAKALLAISPGNTTSQRTTSGTRLNSRTGSDVLPHKMGHKI